MSVKLKLRFFIILLTAIGSWTTTRAQLFIDTTYSVEEMVLDFFDNTCVTPSNITYSGAPGTIAFFDAGNANLGVSAGIYLGTGLATGAIGPNDSGLGGAVTGGGNDPDLEAIAPGFFTFDAAVLEMDIIATESQLEFSYVFASEEYPEYINSDFNDIFAFFISGPGISGMQNIALAPNSTEPVSVNTVNSFQNAQYYLDNANGSDIQFDGYTTALTATANVSPNATYHVKIAIADVSDAVFDSGIFIGVESLCGSSLLAPIAQYASFVDELTLSVENQSKYATDYFWDFGDNTTSTEKHPAPHSYAAEGIYEVTLIAQNYCCSDTMTTQVNIGNATGIEELALKPYRFFPNPADDFAQLIFENGNAFTVKVFNGSGQLVLQQNEKGRSALHIEGLTEGVYFLEVTSEGKIYRDKFLKLE